MEELVPGDIVNIEAGDLVPADGRIVRAATLEIDESALTGESAPVPKQVDAVAADAALGDRVDMAFMNTQVTRGAGDDRRRPRPGWRPRSATSRACSSSTTAEETPLTKQLNTLTNQILIIAGVSLVDLDRPRACTADQPFQELFLTAVAFAVSAIPTGLPAVVTTILANGHADARRGRRDREAAPLGRDARLDVRDQLRQDRHPDAQPDDRRPDGRSSAGATRSPARATRPTGQITGTPATSRGPARAVPAADGAVRRRRGQGRRARRRPDRGRAGRARRQGRRRSGADPRAVPAHRRGAVRRGLQADGHVPRDEGRRRARTSSAATSRARRTSSWPAPTTGDDGTGGQVPVDRRPATSTWPRTSGSGRQGLRVMATGQQDFDPATFDPTPPTCCRSSATSRCWRSSASSIRRGRRRRPRSPSPMRPASRSG